jgi:hypothetical protein
MERAGAGVMKRSMGLVLASIAMAVLTIGPFPWIAGAHADAAPARVPALAYYYIWYTPSSWDRAKTDLPLLGKYSSDDVKVMKQHVMWAKQAGINGFIVSWKHTPALDRSLSLLTDVAEEQHFSLSIIYQALDFDRNPQPVERVAEDLRFFAKTFAPRTPFHLFSKPLVIWSGTWMYDAAAISGATAPVRTQLLVLGSEKNSGGYERIADAVDGDAYYWSSVNPSTNKAYLDKLIDMANSVHRRGGLWIAPAAPGFDARKIGGSIVVDRRDGETFSHELATASASAPDALGIISWNEFSENSQIEPSRNYGYRTLDVLASRLANGSRFSDVKGSDAPDSSASGGGGVPLGLITGPVFVAIAVAAAVVVYQRSAAHQRRRAARTQRTHRRTSESGSSSGALKTSTCEHRTSSHSPP